MPEFTVTDEPRYRWAVGSKDNGSLLVSEHSLDIVKRRVAEDHEIGIMSARVESCRTITLTSEWTHGEAVPENPLVALADGWLDGADELDKVTDEDDEVGGAIVTQLREDAHALLNALGLLDTASSASRQHYIETGRYLRVGEAEEVGA